VSSPEAILRYLAGLAPSRRSVVSASLEAISSPRDFIWLGKHSLTDNSHLRPPPYGWYERRPGKRLADGVALALDDSVPGFDPYTYPQQMRVEGLERLASLDALDPQQDSLRAGAMWLIGRHRDGDSLDPIFMPVISRRVRIHPAAGLNTVQPEWKSDVEVHPMFAEVMTEDELDKVPTRGVGTALVETLCKRLGLPHPELTGVDRNPLTLARQVKDRSRHESDVLYLGPGAAVFVVAPDAPTTIAAGLKRWTGEISDGTAFARLYGKAPISADADEMGGELQTTLPTNARQRAAIVQSRCAEVSVVSGPPGTGKTHLVVAAAIDAISRGEAVLIATQSDHAAESVSEVLGRYPAPPHVRFGRAEHRLEVAERLSAGRLQAPSDRLVDEAETRESASRERREEILRVIRSALEREAALDEGIRHRDSLPMLTADAPGVLRPDIDHHQLVELLARVDGSTSRLARWRSKKAQRKLRRLVDARSSAGLDEVTRAVRVALAARDVEQVLASGGVSLDPFWADLAEADEQWRADLADLVDVRRRHAGRLRRRRARASVAALANVLRAGQARRSTLLSDIESDDFLDLLPLWVGTVTEVERTLPVIPELFDLLILDEASQIDQIHAAGALCRARRVMVVGDPKQLRHVSFVADDQMEEVFDRVGLEDPTLRRLLDVRRNSVFDVAAAAAEVVWLDEHFRSVPHLIDFSAKHFYDDEIRLMTQHPSVEGQDAIDQMRVEGMRVDGINRAEIDVVRDLIVDLGYRLDTGTIGVVTPFRKQADEMVEMVLDRFSLAQIRQFGLRTGTVHSFQGTERDTVIISLGLGPDDLGQSLRFIEDRNLFNVMITRARRRIVLLHSFDPGDLPRGLLAEYFRFVDDPPVFVERRSEASPWVQRMADALSGPDRRVITNYPVAGWTVDLALGQGEAAFGIECTVHPDGVDAHIERHLTLLRAGWTLTDAFQSRWVDDPEQAAVHLAVELQRRTPTPPPPPVL